MDRKSETGGKFVGIDRQLNFCLQSTFDNAKILGFRFDGNDEQFIRGEEFSLTKPAHHLISLVLCITNFVDDERRLISDRYRKDLERMASENVVKKSNDFSTSRIYQEQQEKLTKLRRNNEKLENEMKKLSKQLKMKSAELSRCNNELCVNENKWKELLRKQKDIYEIKLKGERSHLMENTSQTDIHLIDQETDDSGDCTRTVNGTKCFYQTINDSMELKMLELAEKHHGMEGNVMRYEEMLKKLRKLLKMDDNEKESELIRNIYRLIESLHVK
ncbi:hypothetical protein SNEBB_003727 [Seison nebaliae]|nr:hypothetical protein SNEBB_003727 [Seison nebaliae]